MRPDRFQLLEDIEFVWEVDCADPKASLTHGHLNVPLTYQQWGLGAWAMVQRAEARNGFLDPRRADKLKAIGFTWGKDRDEQWEENFEKLLAFKGKNGHCKVHQASGKNGIKLGNWVRVQRVAKKNETLKPEREARLSAVGFIWNVQSRTETVVEDGVNVNDLDSAKGPNKNGGNDNSKSHSSDQARAGKRSKIQLAQKPPAVTSHATEETADVGMDSGDHVKVGNRLSVRWGDGCYYGGVVTKMKNQDNKQISYVVYDGESVWHDLGMEQFSIVYD
jgi:hypothetical protein